MSTEVNFAILAPVPVEHLNSGLEVCKREGFVAYGSNKWKIFSDVDQLRGGDSVPVLIYPSHESEARELSYEIQWTGFYVGHVESDRGIHPDGMRHRPETTKKYPDDSAWAVYWHVTGLTQLGESARQSIKSLLSYASGKYWKAGTPPRGPEIVARPKLI